MKDGNLEGIEDGIITGDGDGPFGVGREDGLFPTIGNMNGI